MRPPVPSRSRRSVARRAIAAVEMAVCLPVLVLIVLGSIQTCELIHLQHLATIAAYEGTLAMNDPSATRATVIDRAKGLLAEVKIQDATVRLTPDLSRLEDAPIGSLLAVTVEIPTHNNLQTPRVLPIPATLTAQGTVLR